MQIEEQSQVAVVPEIAPAANSKQSVESNPARGRGGRRKGAGRKPNLAKRLLKGFTRETIALAVEDVDVKSVIIGLLKSRSDRTRLETLVFLMETLHGPSAECKPVWWRQCEHGRLASTTKPDRRGNTDARFDYKEDQRSGKLECFARWPA